MGVSVRHRSNEAWESTRPVYDRLVELLEAHEEKPYAVMMGKRQWLLLTRDPRSMGKIISFPGDPDTVFGVPVRVQDLRRPVEVFATADELHEALYGDG